MIAKFCRPELPINTQTNSLWCVCIHSYLSWQDHRQNNPQLSTISLFAESATMTLTASVIVVCYRWLSKERHSCTRAQRVEVSLLSTFQCITHGGHNDTNLSHNILRILLEEVLYGCCTWLPYDGAGIVHPEPSALSSLGVQSSVRGDNCLIEGCDVTITRHWHGCHGDASEKKREKGYRFPLNVNSTQPFRMWNSKLVCVQSHKWKQHGAGTTSCHISRI